VIQTKKFVHPNPNSDQEALTKPLAIQFAVH